MDGELGPSSITQKQRWAAELRAKGFAVLSPAEVKALLTAMRGHSVLPGRHNDTLRHALETLREAQRIQEARRGT